MKELRIGDRELQALIAPALTARLKAEGFHTGVPTTEHCGFYFPINLCLAGDIEIVRHEDGTWIFSQEVDDRLASRTFAALEDHSVVCATAAVAFKGAG